MEIEKDYQGYKKWKHGARQHLHAGKGEGILDVVRYMRDHLKYFKLDNELTFNERDIIQIRDEYIVTLLDKPDSNNVIRPGIAHELEVVSKK